MWTLLLVMIMDSGEASLSNFGAFETLSACQEQGQLVMNEMQILPERTVTIGYNCSQ